MDDDAAQRCRALFVQQADTYCAGVMDGGVRMYSQHYEREEASGAFVKGHSAVAMPDFVLLAHHKTARPRSGLATSGSSDSGSSGCSGFGVYACM